jgi:hypothetical protein
MPPIKSTLTVLALSLFASNAFAGWAQFCNDDNCSEGCGAAVDLDNPGCLNQYNRRSIKFSGTISQDVNLVASPNPGCDCQNYCEETIQRAWTGVFDQRPSCFTLRDEEVSFSFLSLVVWRCGGVVVIHMLTWTWLQAQSFRFLGAQHCDADQC